MFAENRYKNLQLMSIIFICRHDKVISPEVVAQKINVDKTTAETIINQLIESELIFGYNPNKPTNAFISIQKFEELFSCLDEESKEEMKKNFCLFNENMDSYNGQIIKERPLDIELIENMLKVVSKQECINISVLQELLHIDHIMADKLLSWLIKQRLIEKLPDMYKVKTVSTKFLTGFTELDNLLNIDAGNLVTIGGDINIGKTSFICSVIENIIDSSKVLFFSMESTKNNRVELLIERIKDRKENLSLIRNLVDFDNLLITIAEHKLKFGTNVVLIDNFNSLLSCSTCSEKKLALKLKQISEKLKLPIITIDNIKHTSSTQGGYLSHKPLLTISDKIIKIERSHFNDDALVFIQKAPSLPFSRPIFLQFDNESLVFIEEKK